MDMYLAVAILRVPDGLDYSNVVEEEEDKMVGLTADKRNESDTELLKYNRSAGQLSQLSQGFTVFHYFWMTNNASIIIRAFCSPSLTPNWLLAYCFISFFT